MAKSSKLTALWAAQTVEDFTPFSYSGAPPAKSRAQKSTENLVVVVLFYSFYNMVCLLKCAVGIQLWTTYYLNLGLFHRCANKFWEFLQLKILMGYCYELPDISNEVIDKEPIVR